MSQNGKKRTNNATTTEIDDKLREEMLAEYGALRSEILKRLSEKYLT